MLATGISLAVMLLALAPTPRAESTTSDWSPAAFNQLLARGRLADAEAACRQLLDREPTRDDARLALGLTQALRGVERCGQRLYRFGYRRDSSLDMLFYVGVVVPRLLVPRCPDPEPVAYGDVRAMMSELLSQLAAADATLAAIRDDSVQLGVNLVCAQLDVDGDGLTSYDESLWRIFAWAIGTQWALPDDESLVAMLDRADVEWLRGYCHLLSALLEVGLAYDAHELFERVGHLVFEQPVTPYGFLIDSRNATTNPWGETLVDLIAGIHLLNFPVAQPQRLHAAREHLLAMIRHSRAMLDCIASETDDDREWIPSPTQHGVLSAVRTTDRIMDAWHEFLAESEALLEGRKLIPFWRTGEQRGVNLKRVFEEPRTLDLVLWVQGTAAAPYLETGELTSPNVWDRLMSVFEGRFMTYAVFLN